jgi:hypothetical protein
MEQTMKTLKVMQMVVTVVGALVCLAAAALNVRAGHYGLSSTMLILALVNIRLIPSPPEA